MARINARGLGLVLKPGHPVTLVLGAGVSRARGVPLWTELLREAWKVVFDEDPYASDADLLKRARAAGESAGLPSAFLDRLDVRRHPFEVQFAFEEIFDRLRWSESNVPLLKRLGVRRGSEGRTRPRSNEHRASELLTDLLRKILYAGESGREHTLQDEPDTLSLIAEAVYASALSEQDQRLISQVITFNVDDLLEREANSRSRRLALPPAQRWDRVPPAVPIYRASAFRPLPVRQAIAIYHLHGFVPKDASRYEFRLEDSSLAPEDLRPPAESLVFTDEQYWRSVGNLSGFASRVFLNALSERCVFIGLSMTDLNIIRWLAIDAIERSDDFREMAGGWEDPAEVEWVLGEYLSRHYWITDARNAKDDSFSAAVLRSTLWRRGIQIIDIPSWESKAFHAWWRARFLAPTAKSDT